MTSKRYFIAFIEGWTTYNNALAVKLSTGHFWTVHEGNARQILSFYKDMSGRTDVALTDALEWMKLLRVPISFSWYVQHHDNMESARIEMTS
jgi:hypothetical protein